MSEPTYTLRPLPFSTGSRAFAALVAIGTRLRVGTSKRGELERWLVQPSSDDEAFWADARREALAEAARVEAWVSGGEGEAGAVLVARDRLESALVAMGAASHVSAELAGPCEREVAAALDRLDGDARSRPELSERVRGSDVSSLRRMAELDPASWWLDEAATAPVVAGGALLRAVREKRASAPAPSIDLALRMSASRLAKTTPTFLYAEVVGQEDEEPAGAIVVARLCDDAVAVHALGLGDADAPPGLLVHLEAGEGTLSVDVVPALARPPVQVKRGYWIPLAGTARGEYTLNVRHRHGDAELEGAVPIIVT